MGYANDDGGVDDEPALPTVETSREMTAKKFCDLNWNTWILRRHLLSQFKKFVHNQKGCHRVYGWKCDDCILEKRKNGKTRKELERELKDLKRAYKKILVENYKKSTEIEKLQRKRVPRKRHCKTHLECVKNFVADHEHCPTCNGEQQNH
ncbi:hypothetical protein B9Z55_004406 [Caenorhabditis nigoni]|uniref:Uncharacterized protein n=1 Tax=Caenorhabditis nigoni TaxID=1611254 RepID=A0A2G5UW69_9PELO|nr:hypothetical protein B9Z55_004406 [Caenorhabditis nigoni]